MLNAGDGCHLHQGGPLGLLEKRQRALTLDSVGFLDLRLGWKNDAWRIGAYVENVTDTEHFAFRVDSGVPFNLFLYPTPPRTAGVEVSYQFSNGG